MTAALSMASTLEEFAIISSKLTPISERLALDRAKGAFADTIACMIAGVGDQSTLAVLNAVQEAGTGRCSAVGRSALISTENAAMVNGTSAHALDFDDNFLPAVTHASAVLVPALMALGEETGALGGVLLEAYIIGLEAQAWLGRLMMPDHYAAGWHATSTIGAIGAAAACARILSLGPEQFLNALSIASSMAGGSKLQFGTMTKPLHAGLAARAGITAAKLAASGVEANPDPISGDWGFIELQRGRHQAVPETRTELSIITDGLAQKRFPCCASAHRTLDAIVQLRRSHNLDSKAIVKIETIIPGSNFRNLRFNTPRNEREARFSMTYCAALAALFGELKLSDFTHEAIQRPQVWAMMQNIEMQSLPAQSGHGSGIWEHPAETKIRLRDGTVLESTIFQPVGSNATPLPRDDFDAKFSDCTRDRLSPEACRELRNILQHFEITKSSEVAEIFRKALPP